MGLTVGSDEIQILDGKIRNLLTDVKNKADASNPPFVLVLVDMNTLAAGWFQWRSSHVTIIDQTGAQVGAEFEQFTGEYNELLRRFKELGGQTMATPATVTESPAATTSDTIVKGGLIVGAFFILWKILEGGKE